MRGKESQAVDGESGSRPQRSRGVQKNLLLLLMLLVLCFEIPSFERATRGSFIPRFVCAAAHSISIPYLSPQRHTHHQTACPVRSSRVSISSLAVVVRPHPVGLRARARLHLLPLHDYMHSMRPTPGRRSLCCRCGPRRDERGVRGKNKKFPLSPLGRR